MFHQFEGIVLRAIRYRESDQIVTVFTQNRGKMAFMARGSKKMRSRFGSVTEPFTKAAFLCFGGSGMLTLSQADLIDSHQDIRSDLLLTAYGAYWVELIDKLTEERELTSMLYHLFEAALQKLVEGTDADILTRIMELRIMEQTGFKPVLHQCVQCQATSLLVGFSVRQGGLLCNICRNESRDPIIAVSESTARILVTLQRIDLGRLGKISVREETKSQLEKVLEMFMAEYVHTEMKSRKVLKQMKVLEPDC